MKHRAAFYFLLALLFGETLPAAAEAPVPVGVILPLSGNFAVFGEQAKASLVAGAPSGIRLVFEDDKCEPAAAISAFHKLTGVDRVRFVFGPACGSSQKAVAPLLAERRVVAMAFSSAPRSLGPAAGGNFFFAQTSIEAESALLAEEMNKRALTRAVVVYVDNDFSRAHEDAFRGHFKGEVLETLRFPAFDPSHAAAAALSTKKLQPDVVFIPDAAPLLLGFMTKIRSLGLKDINFFSVYSAQMKSVLDAEKGHAEGLLYSYPAIGREEAGSYFPRKAAEIFGAVIVECGGRTDCVKTELPLRYPFDEFNVLRTPMTLKMVQHGSFQGPR